MVKTFAAIDVGSYELSLKIYEVTKKNGLKQVDYLRHKIDMGTETYAAGKLSPQRIDELCEVLNAYKKIMKTYRVENYVAYGTSAIRETVNTTILLSQIYQRTGIKVSVLSNSEQRFLDYKSIAFQGEKFNKFIEKGTAIYDVGGGSIQISLFDEDKLVSTQNMKLGVLRILDRMHKIGAPMGQYGPLISEIIDSQLSVYKKLYLKDRMIENLIIVDDYIGPLIKKGLLSEDASDTTDIATLKKYIEKYRGMDKMYISKKLSIPEEDVEALYASAVMLREVMLTIGAVNIWAPGVTLCDGIAYEYADKNGLISTNHNFDEDIVACAMQISKRYMGSRKRAETIENLALTIFDATKDIHGLSQRDRLLLRLSGILHDCGKYISMANLAECSYNIIMSTEIIGLSHNERMIVANAVKFNQFAFEYYKELSSHEDISIENHMRLAKITAILRLANGLDRSHKRKFKNVEVSVNEDKLIISVNTNEDILVEKGLFANRADFFKEVFNLEPVIKQNRNM